MLTGPMINRRSNAKTAYGLMTDIRAYILEEPKRIFMGEWIIKGAQKIEETLETKGPICGTVGCIAGNATLLAGRGDRSIFASALDLLSGDDDELGEHLSSLFYGTAVDAEYGTKKYARIVAQRITKFQQKHKAALQRVKISA